MSETPNATNGANGANIQRSKIPLPVDVDAMLDRKTTPDTRTMNDHVDDIHVMLFASSEKYRELLDAVYDVDATEGSLSYDNHKACEMIRETAKDMGRPYLVGKKLASINKALQVVLRRYRMTRKERAITVDGQQVPPAPATNNNEE